MPRTSLMSVRMSERLAERLESLAKATDRSKSYLAALAIEEFVVGKSGRFKQSKKVWQKLNPEK
jgi:predicted transcriptional regulator